MATQRHKGIDAFRYLAFAAVVTIHAFVTGIPTPDAPLGTLIQTAMRFAVPFFFMCSGYFLKPPHTGTLKEIRNVAYRLAPIQIVWLLYYLAVFTSVGYIVSHPTIIARIVAVGWPAYHFWFIPTLGVCLTMLIILRRWLNWWQLFAVAAALYAIGLAFGCYHALLGLPKVGLNMRDGPFFGFFFVLIGYYLAQNPQKRLSLPLSWALFVAGFILTATELWLIGQATDGRFITVDFSLSTLIFGLGAFSVASHTKAEGSFMAICAKFGPISLGMYCAHVMILEAIRIYLPPAELENRVLATILTIAITTFTVAMLAKSPWLKRIVS